MAERLAADVFALKWDKVTIRTAIFFYNIDRLDKWVA
jgi:hypothetical protein